MHPRKLLAYINRTILVCSIAGVFSSRLSAQTSTSGITPPDDTPPAEVEIKPGAAPTAPQDDQVVVLDAFVITGTQIRGVEPIGTNLIGLDKLALQKTGATSTNDVLAAIPQLSMFNSIPAPTADFGSAIVRPNIRNLGGSGANTTLVLLNGHRLVGAGILQTTPDASIVPPGMIERVELVPDGGSAIYGSDAVGGVINFITRQKFSGTELSTHYGVADEYFTTDVNLTTGRSWEKSSIVFSYIFAKHDAIMGSDRDYFSSDHRARGGSDLRTDFGSPGNIKIGSLFYDAATFAPLTTANKYDASEFANIYPAEERHSVFGTFSHQLNEQIDFTVSAYWSQRETTTYTAQATLSGTITAANPYFRAIGTETSQTIQTNYSSVFGTSNETPAEFSSWGITPEFKIQLGGDWQLRIPLNYGESDSTNRDHTNVSNVAAKAALAGTTTSTALNPYNLAATDPAVLASIRDYEFYANSKQTLAHAEAIADGTIGHLPAGKAKLALGVSSSYESIDARTTTGRINSSDAAAHASASRDVNSVFGELNIPLISARNSLPGVNALRLALSGRFDRYSDFGNTTNPKIGLTYQPVESVVFRANYGTSFNAPSLADGPGAVDSRAQFFATSVPTWMRPDRVPADFSRPMILLAGGNPDGLKPMKAKTWSLGADWFSKQIKGLTVSATYYKIQLTDYIGVTPFYNPSIMFGDPAFADDSVIYPTLEQAKAFIGNTRLDGFASVESLYAGDPSTYPYAIYRAQRNNLGSLYTDGIDVAVAYVAPTRFGQFHSNLSGNITLSRNQKAVASSPWQDLLAASGVSRYQASASVGLRVGKLDTTVSATYSSRQPIGSGLYVASYAPINLFFSYDLSEDRGWKKGLSLTLNVNNVFDRDPPFRDSVASSVATGYGTLGRLVMLGVRKRF